MTPDQFARAKAVFLEARKLRRDLREPYLNDVCSDDADVLAEVTSLLKHDSPETILATPSPTYHDSPPRFLPARFRLAGRLEHASADLLRRALGSRGKRLLALLSVLGIMVILAWWTNAGMQGASRSIAESQLKTILAADITALELWIKEKKKDVKIWSSRTEMREAVAALARLADSALETPDALRNAPARSDLRELLEDFDRITGRSEQDAIINREGLILATEEDENVGGRLNEEGLAALVPVFQGQTTFLRPQPKGAFGMDRTPDLNKPMVYVVTPVLQSDNDHPKIIAAAAFGFPADDEFSHILSVARLGETGETYIFDEQGVLLSESRFEHELRKTGVLSSVLDEGSIFRVEIRDPGARSRSQPLSEVESAERPLTDLAAKAIAAARKGVVSDEPRVILAPYRNYRGARVIGAWQWLTDYSFGVAMEVEVEELYAPIRFPVTAEWIRFGLLAGCLASLVGAAGWLSVLGRDMEEARQLGQYTLEEKIGEGGMGVVYRARHALLQRETAIKLLRPENTNNEESLARFEREVQTASSLTHPNTIDIFDFGRTPQNSFYCAMELLDGQTLEQIVRSHGPLPATRTLNILRQIAGSLNEAHQRGLIHRDIKPANIMLCEQGGIPDFVKVLDFGLARTIERSDANDVTQFRSVAGTPLFLAPERITDPMTIDQRSDLYAFGSVGYYLLTGTNIYECDNQVELLHMILSEDPRPPSEITENKIPKELENLLLQCLARRPADRPANMQKIIIDLENFDR